MKIVLITPNYPVERNIIRGGVEGVCFYLVNGMAKIIGVKVHVIVPFSHNGKEIIIEREKSAIIYRMPGDNKTTRYWSFAGKRAYKKILELLNELKPTVVHVHSMASLAKYMTNYPCVLTIHGFHERDVIFRSGYFTSLLKRCVLYFTEIKARRKIKNIIAINPFVQEYVGKYKGQTFWNVCNPVADSFFKMKRNAIKLRIFTASRLVEEKNIVGLIEVVRIIKKDIPRIQLHIAGSGLNEHYGQKCFGLVQKYGLTKNIRFVGQLNIQQLQNELSQSQLFILMSHQENAPLSVSEAMASGVPVIASNVGGLKWMIKENVNGHIVEPGDVNAAAETLRKMLVHENLEKMGKNARAIAAKTFKSDVVARQTLKVYESIVKKDCE